MGAHTGRCFRARRKTARRKVRQIMALAAMKQVASKDANLHGLARAHIHRLTVWEMNEHQKRLMVQGFERAKAKGMTVRPVRIRREARGG